MIRFENDYSEGCHPKILELLRDTNFEQAPGYCTDVHCEKARDLVREACKTPDANAYFVSGGTQANKVVTSQLLRPYEGVISSDLGHIATHEAGAVEASGHKVLIVKNEGGKLTARGVSEYMENFWADETREHQVQPAMVYISIPTELGTIYSKDELVKLRETCDRFGLILYVDGARLGYALVAPNNDLSFEDIARYTDVFSIGGTKVGALFGECIVFPRPGLLDKNFRTLIKSKGAMLAKGFVLGKQFEALLSRTEGSDEMLYLEISKNAIRQATKIKNAFIDKGYKFWVDSPTNQIFPILPRMAIDELKEHFSFQIWPDLGQAELITRFCTSWCTSDKDTDELVEAIRNI
ncbi:MAG: aminotransferase class V-fold PLP-dependent enzyme [Burkholderiales bacterium]|nr:aminotransferase class V-fold PLP-dependent enzyme [Burkholderiales bacterium]